MATLKYKDPTSGKWERLSGYIYLGNDIPVGAICSYSGDEIPDDYLLCDGSSLLRSTYPDLFSVIGTKYGSIDDLHFNLPDLRNRVGVGKSSSSPYNILGNTGGETSHTLTIAEMPAHSHKTWIQDTAYSERGDGYQNYFYGQGRYYNNTSTVRR